MKKIRVYTTEEKKELVGKVGELVSQGRTRKEAIKEVGIGTGSYYLWKRTAKRQTKRRTGGRAKLDLVSVPYAPEPAQGLVAFYGSPADVVLAITQLGGRHAG